uniref:Uncharacterized protein n=1 Tax=Caenorhabditis japonica TaxID=281687 RepID=A0A8R1DXN3_CAEJA
MSSVQTKIEKHDVFDKETRAVINADIIKMAKMRRERGQGKSPSQVAVSTTNTTPQRRATTSTQLGPVFAKREERRIEESDENKIRQRKISHNHPSDQPSTPPARPGLKFPSTSYFIYRCIFLIFAIFVVPYILSLFR